MQSHSALVLRVTDAYTPKPKGLPPRLHSCYLWGLGGFSFWSVKINDRELLELAAKAAGYTITDWCDGRRRVAWAELSDTSKWNPIEDDGDALRLAVKQNMTLAVGVARSDAGEFTEFDLWETDKYAATRRAIVRAAAEIGRQMQEGGAA